MTYYTERMDDRCGIGDHAREVFRKSAQESVHFLAVTSRHTATQERERAVTARIQNEEQDECVTESLTQAHCT